MQFKLTCKTCRRPKVGAVRIVQFDFNYPLVFAYGGVGLFVQFGLGAGEAVFEHIVRIFFTEQVKKQFFVYVYFRHILSKYTTGLSKNSISEQSDYIKRKDRCL